MITTTDKPFSAAETPPLLEEFPDLIKTAIDIQDPAIKEKIETLSRFFFSSIFNDEQ